MQFSMKNVFIQPYQASLKVLQNRKYTLLFLTLIPIISFLLFLIPVKYIPGNSINFQATLFTTSDYLLLVILSVLESLLLVMFLYLFKLTRRRANIATAGHGGMGMLSVVPAFLFGTKLCPMCLAGIFGALGISTGMVFPLLLYRQWVFIASIGVLLLSLYFVSKKINSDFCVKCK